jgi:hypothetical protein
MNELLSFFKLIICRYALQCLPVCFAEKHLICRYALQCLPVCFAVFTGMLCSVLSAKKPEGDTYEILMRIYENLIRATPFADA